MSDTASPEFGSRRCRPLTREPTGGRSQGSGLRKTRPPEPASATQGRQGRQPRPRTGDVYARRSALIDGRETRDQGPMGDTRADGGITRSRSAPPRPSAASGLAVFSVSPTPQRASAVRRPFAMCRILPRRFGERPSNCSRSRTGYSEQAMLQVRHGLLERLKCPAVTITNHCRHSA